MTSRRMMDVAPKNCNKEHQGDLVCKRTENQAMRSEEHEFYNCSKDSNVCPKLLENVQTSEESSETGASQYLKSPINENSGLLAEQVHLELGGNINEYNSDKANGNQGGNSSYLLQEKELLYKREEDEGREDAEKLEQVSTEISEVKDVGGQNTETVVKEQMMELRISGNKLTCPNYFVAIPITNDQILDLIEDVQEHIVLKESKLLRALIPASKVHLTILVACLKSKEDIKRAVSALMESKKKVEELLQGQQLGLPLHGIGQFNNQVIYIKIAEHEQEILSKIADAVTQSFTNLGVNMTGSKDFKPHLTFLKLSKVPALRRKGFRKICSDLYKEYEDCSFGIEMFNRIDLCSMHKKNKLSDYYYCESSILLDTIEPPEMNRSISKTKEESNVALKGQIVALRLL